MRLNEKNIRRLALVISISVHALILFIPITRKIKTSQPKRYKVPIQLQVSVPIVKEVKTATPKPEIKSTKGKSRAQIGRAHV